MAIDTAKAKEHLFPKKKNMPIKVEEPLRPEPIRAKEDAPSKSSSPTVETIDAELLPVLVPLSIEDKDMLDKIAKKIMVQRRRVKSKTPKQRITTNSLIRAMIKNFISKHHTYDLGAIMNEEELLNEFLNKNLH
jgi:hypothetical protein